MAYVTNDLKRAVEVMGERYGIKAFMHVDSPCNGGELGVELAWVGGVMIELIEARGPGTEFYTDRLPKNDFAVRHHHHAYLAPDLPAWESLMAHIERLGWPIVFSMHMEGMLRLIYVEAPDLGHYLEYIFLEPAGIELFEGIPAN